MAIRQIPGNTNFAGWLTQMNLLATDFGDLATFSSPYNVADPLDNVVNIVKWMNHQVEEKIISEVFSLPNNVYLKGDSGLGAPDPINVVRVSVLDQLEFGAPISGISIVGGTITGLSSPLPVGSGGTGATTIPGILTALGLRVGLEVQAYSPILSTLAGLTAVDSNIIMGSGASWAVATPATARDKLALQPGRDVQVYSANLKAIADMVPSSNMFIMGSGASWAIKNYTEVRAALQLVPGTNVQAQSDYLQNIADTKLNIGGAAVLNNDVLVYDSALVKWTNKHPLEARSALGLRIGQDVQGFSAQLNQIAVTTPINGDFLVYTAGAWTSRNKTLAQADLSLVPGTDVQAYNIQLKNIADITGQVANSGIMWSGTAWVKKSPLEIRTALGLQKAGDTVTQVQSYYSGLDDIGAMTPTLDNFLCGNGSNWTKITGASLRSKIGAAAVDVNGANSDLKRMSLVNYIKNTTQDILMFTDNGSAWVGGQNTIGRAIYFGFGDATDPSNNYNIKLAGTKLVWKMGQDGHLVPGSASSYNIGASDNRIANVYGVNGDFSTGLTVGSLTSWGTVYGSIYQSTGDPGTGRASLELQGGGPWIGNSNGSSAWYLRVGGQDCLAGYNRAGTYRTIQLYGHEIRSTQPGNSDEWVRVDINGNARWIATRYQA